MNSTAHNVFSESDQVGSGPSEAMDKRPPVNCHTHVFTGDHVPPFLAKCFLPLGLYYLLPLSMVIGLVRTWVWLEGLSHRSLLQRLRVLALDVWVFIRKVFLLQMLHGLLGAVFFYHSFFVLWDAMASVGFVEQDNVYVSTVREWLENRGLLYPITGWFASVLCLVVWLLLFPSGRNLMFFLLRKLSKWLASLPGDQTLALLERYFCIAQFSRYQKQGGIFSRLMAQYDPGTQFVVLPMDMDFMGAGRAPVTYPAQLLELAKLKNTKTNKGFLLPFIFADPRRMRRFKSYFNYEVVNGEVVLGGCSMKLYLEQEGFAGIKIYPALGYFPFDEALLPLWKYAADKGIPILTHCIRGNIFYRGRKKSAWDRHPVFMESYGYGEGGQLLLPEKKNIDFSVNFTHPLNFLCLLDRRLLCKLVREAKDKRLWDVFGYNPVNDTLAHGLEHLKICMGHFGGEDEWARYFEADRNTYSQQVKRYPNRGIEFLEDVDGNFTLTKAAQIWRGCDWYSIICSLMLQYPNVYADLSFILHDTEVVHPLLKQTMQHPVLRQRVLYGTDFYVVRNHKSDKHLHATMLDCLDKEEYKMVVVENPGRWLGNKIKNRLEI